MSNKRTLALPKGGNPPLKRRKIDEEEEEEITFVSVFDWLIFDHNKLTPAEDAAFSIAELIAEFLRCVGTPCKLGKASDNIPAHYVGQGKGKDGERMICAGCNVDHIWCLTCERLFLRNNWMQECECCSSGHYQAAMKGITRSGILFCCNEDCHWARETHSDSELDLY